MKQFLSELVVISAFRNSRSHFDNTKAHLDLGAFLNAINVKYREVIGVYNHNEEKSYIIWLNNPIGHTVESLLTVASRMNQESINRWLTTFSFRKELLIPASRLFSWCNENQMSCEKQENQPGVSTCLSEGRISRNPDIGLPMDILPIPNILSR